MKKAPQGPCNGLDPQKNPVETLIPGNLAQAIKKGSVSLSERKRVPKIQWLFINYPMKLANIYRFTRFTPNLLRQPSKKKHVDTGKGPFDWMPVGHIKKIHKNVENDEHMSLSTPAPAWE